MKIGNMITRDSSGCQRNLRELFVAKAYLLPTPRSFGSIKNSDKVPGDCILQVLLMTIGVLVEKNNKIITLSCVFDIEVA
jgi:hypothetical protein